MRFPPIRCDWLRSLAITKDESFESFSLGDNVRLESRKLIGTGLVIEDHPVRVELYPNDER